jgi:hypothetical protein
MQGFHTVLLAPAAASERCWHSCLVAMWLGVGSHLVIGLVGGIQGPQVQRASHVGGPHNYRFLQVAFNLLVCDTSWAAYHAMQLSGSSPLSVGAA